MSTCLAREGHVLGRALRQMSYLVAMSLEMACCDRAYKREVTRGGESDVGVDREEWVGVGGREDETAGPSGADPGAFPDHDHTTGSASQQ